MKTTNKNKQEKKIYSPTDQYNLKIGNYLNQLQRQQGVTISQSKWQHNNPTDSRLLNYTTNLRVTTPSSITTNMSLLPNHCPNPIQTKQQIDHKIVNNLPQNFSKLTGINIVLSRKLPNRIIEPTTPNTSKQPTNNNQHKSKSRKSPNNKEWTTQQKSKFRTTTKLTKMVQTKLIKTIDEDPNLPFGDSPSIKTRT